MLRDENDDRYMEEPWTNGIANTYMRLHPEKYRCSTCGWWVRDDGKCLFAMLGKGESEQSAQPSDGSGMCREWED